MKSAEIVIPAKGDSKLLDEAQRLWKAFYDDMSRNGLLIPMVPEGDSTWRQNITPTLGRVSHMVLLRSEGQIAGIALGILRLLPEHLGNKLIGFISGIYIDPAFRREGFGRMLYAELERWFNAKQVDSYELQVLTQNPGAIAFWESLGYEPELLQMRKLLTKR